MMVRSNYQTRTAKCEYRAEENGHEKIIEGYFAVFGGLYEIEDGMTESVAPTAFEGAPNEDIRCLIDHETRLVLGRTTAGTLTLRTDEKGLWGRVVINERDQDAVNLYERVKRGDVNQCSFGFEILDEETSWREGGSVHFTIKRVKLYEVSVVTFPAYRDTGVAARAAQRDKIKKRMFDAWRENVKRRLRGHGTQADCAAQKDRGTRGADERA